METPIKGSPFRGRGNNFRGRRGRAATDRPRFRAAAGEAEVPLREPAGPQVHPALQDSRTVTANASRVKALLPRVLSQATLEKAQKFFESYGYAVMQVHLQTTHPIQHAARQILTQVALACCAKGVVLDICGSKRTFEAASFLNQGVVPADTLQVVATAELYAPGDLARGVRDLVAPKVAHNIDAVLAQQPIDNFLMVDVYFQPNPANPSAECGPDTIAGFLAKGRPGASLYWVGTRFNAEAIYGPCCNEGAWVQTSENPRRVTTRPDATTPAYPPHPSCDWIWAANTAFTSSGPLSWTLIKNIDSLHLVKFSLTQVMSPLAPLYPLGEAQVFEALIPDLSNAFRREAFARFIVFCNKLPLGSSLLAKWPWFFASKKIVADVQARTLALEYLASRPVGVYSYRQVAVNVKEALLRRVGYQLMRLLFPERLDSLIDDTVHAAMVTASDRTADIVALTTLHNNSFAERNLALKNIGEPLPIGQETPLGSGFASAADVKIVCALLALYTLPDIVRTLSKTRNLLKWIKTKLWTILKPLLQVKASSLVVDASWLSKTLTKVCSWPLVQKVGKTLQSRLAQLNMDNSQGNEARMVTLSAWLEELVRYFIVGPTVQAGAGSLVANLSVGAFVAADWHADHALGRAAAAQPAQAAVFRYVLHSSFTQVHLLHPGALTTILAFVLHAGWNLNAVYMNYATTCSARFSAGLLALLTCFLACCWLATPKWPKKSKPVIRQQDTVGSATLVWNASDNVQKRCAYTAVPDVIPSADVHYLQQARPEPVLREEEAGAPIHLLRPTNVKFQYMARTDANLHAAITKRLLAAPPCAPIEQELAWADLSIKLADYPPNGRNLMKILFPPGAPVMFGDNLPDYLAHVDPAKRKRAAAALECWTKMHYHPGHKVFNLVELMVKTNEALLKPQPIARTIGAVNPVAAVYTGSQVFVLQQRFKNAWDIDCPCELTLPECVTLAYGGSCSVAQLSAWYNRSLNAFGFHILVSGDDSLVIKNHNGALTIFEADASAFDQSQSTGPLNFENEALTSLGAEPVLLECLDALSHAPYLVKFKQGARKILHNKRPMRITGGADTSLGNSAIMGVSWLAVIMQTRASSHALILEHFAFLGFKMKLKEHVDPCQATFLKGWFQQNVIGQYSWVPLPSRLLKFGKSERNPAHLYRRQANVLATQHYTQACRAFLADIAKSYKAYTLCPLVQAMVEACKATHELERKTPPDKVIRVEASFVPAILPFEWAAAVCQRYSVTEKDVETCIQLVTTAPVNAVLSHPIFDKMAVVDYG